MKNNIKKTSVKFWEDLLHFHHFMQIFVFAQKSVIITTLRVTMSWYSLFQMIWSVLMIPVAQVWLKVNVKMTRALRNVNARVDTNMWRQSVLLTVSNQATQCS